MENKLIQWLHLKAEPVGIYLGNTDAVYAVDQMAKDRPIAIMGLFDISQRREDLANRLSLTMPYSLWVGLSDDLDKSCLTTHAWKEIEKRL